MSLITYQQARPWARSIKDRVARRQMPPWHIDPSVGVTKFKNDMSLSEAQIDTIVKWVDAGAPQGDPKDLPQARAARDRQRVAGRDVTASASPTSSSSRPSTRCRPWARTCGTAR